MATPTRYTSGITTVAAAKPLGNFPFPDPFHTSGTALRGIHSYVNDYNSLPGTDYTVTAVGLGTFALGTGVGGVAILSTTAGAADSVTVQKAGHAFSFTSGHKAWFLTRFQLSDNNLSASADGLTDNIANAIYFTKLSGTTAISLVSIVAGVTTTLVPTVVAIANDTYVDIGWYYDGKDLMVFYTDVMVARIPSALMPSGVLTHFSALTNGTALVRTKTLDYVLIADEVVR